ncbi:Fic family protein [Archangium sp.]|uniref:Fic family protein n=1 Tax=Archangium sp. TaxID=1872627 RepID=UPI00286D2FF0|nr:Fic family protein [Archangium sp.]
MHPYHWDAGLEPRLRQVAERVSRLRQARMQPAAIENLRHWFRIHHTYHSNAIEGNRLTLPETRAVLEDGITIAGKPLKDHLEAVNLAQALDFIEELARAETPLGAREVRDIHAIVLRSIDVDNAGNYRRINVRIGGTDYVPPEALAVPERMEELGRWLASDKPEHPLVVAAIAHAWFETIHPFIDGNGRTGRLLANLLLMRHGYPVTVLRVEERARYYTALDQSHTGELSAMVELTLETVERSLAEYERVVQEVEVREPAIEYLAGRLAAVREGSNPEFLAWKYGVEALQRNLDETAERISARLEESADEDGSAIELTFISVPVTEGDWRQAQSKPVGVGQIIARSPRANLTGWLLARPPREEWRWLGSRLPTITLEVEGEPADVPERFALAVPERHLFTAAYATGTGIDALGLRTTVEALRARVSARGTPKVPPPGVTVRRETSALKIATDIWTYLIERHLS